MSEQWWLTTAPEEIDWDVLVVGTGMGGATLGYALARAGRRVLFVEKGTWSLLQPDGAILDRRAEESFVLSALPQAERLEVLARAGRSTDEVEDVSGQRMRRYIPFIGSGTGGSSALYGMALERFFPADFAPRRYHADSSESTLPERWPITYDQLRPWYAAAEDLFRVRGTPDPLRPGDAADDLIQPAPLSVANAALFRFLEGRGLHPYRLHMGCESVPDCATCQGYLCGRSCKNDAGRVCLLPAVERYGARLLSGCRVVRLAASRTAVEQVVCEWRGRSIALKAKLVVLAAGALATPVLLLSSASAVWPHGLANRSGLVGRNLMLHCFDMLLVSGQTEGPLTGKHKEIAFNDYYLAEGQKLGAVQSLGVLPPLEAFANGLGSLARGLRLCGPVLRPFWRRLERRTLVLAMIMEDLPYLDNRVLPGLPAADGRQRIRLRYRLGASERARLRRFRAHVLGLLRPYRPRLIRGAGASAGVQHVCGTCRFGDDPSTSVLDATNRAHGLSNLYVVDASFFPSSGGINPALTVAANALRVADHLHRERLS